MKLQMKFNRVFIIITFYFTFIWCCEYSEKNQRIECSTSVLTSEEEGKVWTNLMIFENTRTLQLKKDAFIKTPNLRKITVKSVISLEQGIFDRLQNLDILEISFANLQEIPKGIIDELHIKTFQLFDAVKKIPSGFFSRVPSLETVIIRNNTLLEIKTGIFINTNIATLYLSYNEIKNIEYGAFYNMIYMTILNLKGNMLTTFDSRLLLGDNILETLWLEENELPNITKNMFSNLNSLRQLFLGTNQIESIEDRSFQVLTKLEFLDLSNNNLKNINPKIFPTEMMKRLFTFFVHNNKLSFINQALFIKAPNLKRLSFGGNPLQCQCLFEVKDWMHELDISRICDDDYFSGERPACVAKDSTKCIADEELSEDLYTQYMYATKHYPILDKKCDTSQGFEYARLHNTYY